VDDDRWGGAWGLAEVEVEVEWSRSAEKKRVQTSGSWVGDEWGVGILFGSSKVCCLIFFLE
jgi:hypothetical protein